MDATNAKAQEDSSFAVITDPNALEAGQKLWIPTLAEPAGQVADEPVDLQQAYQNAAKNAEIAEPAEISIRLTGI